MTAGKQKKNKKNLEHLNNLKNTRKNEPEMEIEITPEDFCRREIKLCEDNNVEIDDYIALKEILIRTGLQKGYVNKESFLKEIQFKDVGFINKIMDLHEEFDLVNFKNK